MSQQEPSDNEIKQSIIYIVETKKPATVKELAEFVQQKYFLPEEKIFELILQLEKENKIDFSKKTHLKNSLQAHIFSSLAIWYWLTIALSIVTVIVVFTIPESAYPLVYVRQVLGSIFVLFLPGYSFIKTLFPSKVPIPTSSENLDRLERVAFGFGTSIALTAIVGLILNYTPWGIRLVPVTLCLFAVTVVFATVSVIREYYAK